MTKSLRYNAPSFVPNTDIIQATIAGSRKEAEPSDLHEFSVSHPENSTSFNIFEGSGTVFTQTCGASNPNYLNSMTSAFISYNLPSSGVCSNQSSQHIHTEFQHPIFSHGQSLMSMEHPLQAELVTQRQDQSSWELLDHQNWTPGSSAENENGFQGLNLTSAVIENPPIPELKETSSLKPCHLTRKSDDYFPEVNVDFVVTDKVTVQIRVEDCPVHLNDVEGINPGLSAGAKEFVPGTPHIQVSTSESHLNGAAPIFISRVLPSMLPDQEVVYPDICEPIFFPPCISEFDDFLPFDGMSWNSYSFPVKQERFIPPNKYQFKGLSDVPPAAKLNKSYPIDLLLAMRSLFGKPEDDMIDIFLKNPTIKGPQKICKYIEENLLIRQAVSKGEYPDRFPRTEGGGFKLTPLKFQKKRKKSKKKASTTTKAKVIPKKLPSPAKKYQLEKTSEHTIKPNPKEQIFTVERKALVGKKSFVKKFKSILNKITPENMKVMTSEVPCTGEKWSKEILQTAISLINANVIRNAAFASVYSEFSLRITGLFPEVDLFKKLILVTIKQTLNLQGEPNSEPKDSIFLSKRLKKLNITNFLGELYLKNLVEIDNIFKISRALFDSSSNEIPGFRKLSIECLVDLVKICGRKLQEEDGERLEKMMGSLSAMSHEKNITKRIRFLLDDLVELSNNKWVSLRSKKEIQPQRIDDLRAEFMATKPREIRNQHSHSPPKSNRNGKTPPKLKKSCTTGRLASKSKKIHEKERGLPKKQRPPSLSCSASSSGVIKSKMNYRMAARSAAEKRQTALKKQMLVKVEMVVKSMDTSKIENFSAKYPDWRTFLLQRLLRKWRLRPHRKAVREIIEALKVEAITASELHEAFRRHGITEEEFIKESNVSKMPKKQYRQSCSLSASEPSSSLEHSRFKEPTMTKVSGCEEKPIMLEISGGEEK